MRGLRRNGRSESLAGFRAGRDGHPYQRAGLDGGRGLGLQPFRAAGRRTSGRRLVVSSVGGLRGGGAAPAYNASKAYQINYAEGLRQRAAKSRLPLYITDVRPGFVDTAMAKGDGLFWVMPVEKAVRQIVRAVRRRRRVAVVTRRWRIAAWLLRHMPDGIYLKM